MAMDMQIDPEALLRLWKTAGIGSLRIRNLMSRFGSPEKVFSASPRTLVEVGGIDQSLARNIKTNNQGGFAREQLRALKTFGVRLVSYWDPCYPSLLEKIYDPPIILFVKGQFEPVERNGMAIVGTRNPSSYGRLMAEKFSRDLARHGFTIVSGLARGIDSCAHDAAVKCGGATLAVLGSGLDRIYPDENKKLAGQICERGALISEYAMGTKPDAPNFPKRNRIISGICVGTIVVEAGQSSGALITADDALEQNREVFAIPGNVNNPRSFGCNRLIQQGAKLVQSVEDILEELSGIERPSTGQQELLPIIDLDTDEDKVFRALTHEPLHIDFIAKQIGLTTAQTLGVLLKLELKSLVHQLPGKMFLKD